METIFSQITKAQNLRAINPILVKSTMIYPSWPNGRLRGHPRFPSAPVFIPKHNVIPLLTTSLRSFLCDIPARDSSIFLLESCSIFYPCPTWCQIGGAMGNTDPNTSLPCLKLASVQHTHQEKVQTPFKAVPIIIGIIWQNNSHVYLEE